MVIRSVVTVVLALWAASAAAQTPIQSVYYTIVHNLVGTATGSVSLTPYDATDHADTISPDGTSKTVTTSIPGQNVKLAFTETAGHRVSLKVGPAPFGGSVSVLDRDGVTRLGSTSIGALNGLIEPIRIPANGTYSIVVNYSGSSTGSVTLNLYDHADDRWVIHHRLAQHAGSKRPLSTRDARQ
jgi:hypothetical protein